MKNSKLKICCLSALMLLGGCESSKNCHKSELNNKHCRNAINEENVELRADEKSAVKTAIIER